MLSFLSSPCSKKQNNNKKKNSQHPLPYTHDQGVRNYNLTQKGVSYSLEVKRGKEWHHIQYDIIFPPKNKYIHINIYTHTRIYCGNHVYGAPIPAILSPLEKKCIKKQ